MGNNRKNNNRQAIIGLALIILILVGDLITGAVSTRAPPPQNNCAGTPVVPYGRTECGSGTCTIPIGSSTCTSIITFPVAFTTAPAPNTGFVSVTTGNPLAGTTTITIPFSYVHWNVISDGSLATTYTWTSMPAAQTEIFGTTVHEIVADWGNQTMADLTLNCPVASNSATAILTVQYSIDTGTTWTSIAGLQINVSATNCGLGTPMDSCFSASQTTFGCYVSIPVAAQVKGVWLRIVGQNGGGIGDNPQFSEAAIITHTVSLSSTTFNRAFSMRITSPSTTSVAIACQATFTVTAATGCPFTWEAFSATG